MRKNKIIIAVLLCLTLGLMPYTPEPHLIGKIRWVLGGANGMKAFDWLDLLWHSVPFIYLVFVLFQSEKKY